jgi:hypothetical protein
MEGWKGLPKLLYNLKPDSLHNLVIYIVEHPRRKQDRTLPIVSLGGKDHVQSVDRCGIAVVAEKGGGGTEAIRLLLPWRVTHSLRN